MKPAQFPARVAVLADGNRPLARFDSLEARISPRVDSVEAGLDRVAGETLKLGRVG